MKHIKRLLVALGLTLVPGVASDAQAQYDDEAYWGDYYYDNDIYEQSGWDYDWWDGWEYETAHGSYDYDYNWWEGEWQIDYEDDWWD